MIELPLASKTPVLVNPILVTDGVALKAIVPVLVIVPPVKLVPAVILVTPLVPLTVKAELVILHLH